jgi:hypothetical protein
VVLRILTLTTPGVVVPKDDIVSVLMELLAEHASELEGKTPAQQKVAMWKVLGQNRDKSCLKFADEYVLTTTKLIL